MVSRDGQSSYFLNATRCRRSDITDLFLGTGLGPHSYAIIEQGMISRLIEARPDDLRLFLEEAAGISRYKERRRETELRLRTTAENIARVNDIRSELVAQLKHLEEQAETAGKYTRLKDQERLLKAQGQALRWRSLDQQAQAEMRGLRELETRVEACMAEVRSRDASVERLRLEHESASRGFNAAQAEFYGLGAQIARQEQAIKSAQEGRQQRLRDLDALDRDIAAAGAEIQADEEKCVELSQGLETGRAEHERLAARAEEATSSLAQAEDAMHGWQRAWEDLTQETAGPTQTVQVERARLQQLERQCQQLEQRAARLREEEQGIAVAPASEALAESQAELGEAQLEMSRLDHDLAEVTAGTTEQRTANAVLARSADGLRGGLHELRGRLASLRALQQEAMDGREEAVTRWLERQGFADAPRLADQLQVEPGWEQAAESALGDHLGALCLAGLEAIEGALQDFSGGRLVFFDTRASANAEAGQTAVGLLREKIQAPWRVDGLVDGIYAVESLGDGLRLKTRLAAHESLVTREGIRLGPNWLRVVRGADPRAGVLSRAREIRELERHEQALAERLADEERSLEEARQALHALEARRESLATEVRETHHRVAELQARCRGEETRLDHARARLAALGAESHELAGQIGHLQTEMAGAAARLENATAAAEDLAGRREAMRDRREGLLTVLNAARALAREEQEGVHRAALHAQSLSSALDSARNTLIRLHERLERQGARRDELQQACEESIQPIEDMRAELQGWLTRRGNAESSLAASRRRVEELQEQLAENEHARQTAASESERLRASQEQLRLRWQELSVRARTLEEDLTAAGFERQALLAELSDEAEPGTWQLKLERLQDRIERLGPVNLAAVDEFRAQSQRKEYLDAQVADLEEAVTTLEGAIRTIDRETRQRFVEIFNRVNERLQALFPRLFGGGQAYLELTGEELLDAGVAIMARPPGKRVSNIHLLSGGEKALTAVALVFAMFELNPAPFCLLDEVDAPLDDANVGRFCQLVKEMSARTQFVFVTHNKVTMELAGQLTGVTMHEPGVSRLVAVDMEEAMAMAAMQA